MYLCTQTDNQGQERRIYRASNLPISIIVCTPSCVCLTPNRFTELLGHQNSPQTRDLPYDVDFGDYEKVLTAFLRRNTLPPNLGWDWELPDKLDLEKHTPLIGPTMEEYTENLLEKGEGFDNDNDLLTGISYTQWWEQPVVLTIFSEGKGHCL